MSVSSGLVAGAVSSPPSCPAPFTSEVRRLAVAAGASWLCLRPSVRSFSRWCVVVYFSSRAAASGFAAPVPAVLPGASFSAGVSSVVVRFCPCLGAFPCGACHSLSLFVCSCRLVSVGGSSAFFYSDRCREWQSHFSQEQMSRNMTKLIEMDLILMIFERSRIR